MSVFASAQESLVTKLLPAVLPPAVPGPYFRPSQPTGPAYSTAGLRIGTRLMLLAMFLGLGSAAAGAKEIPYVPGVLIVAATGAFAAGIYYYLSR